MEIKAGSVIDSIIAIHSKGLNLYWNRLHHSFKVKTDSATAICIKGLKLYFKNSLHHRLQKILLKYYKPIKRHPNNINWSRSSVIDFEHVFVCWGIFKSIHSEKLWKMTLLKHLNSQRNIWCSSSMVVFCSVYKKNLKLYKFYIPAKILPFKSNA